MAEIIPATNLIALQERDVVRQVRDLMEAHGWRYVRMQSAAVKIDKRIIRSGEKGIPDGLYLKYNPDRIVWIEVKQKRGCVSPFQRSWHEVERRKGATVLVIRDIDDLNAWLRNESG